MAELAYSQWKDFLLVIIAIMGFIVLLADAIKAIKEFKSPMILNANWQKETDTKLDRDNKRLRRLEDGIKLLIKAQHAMLQHVITGNHLDKLKHIENELTDYLINR